MAFKCVFEVNTFIKQQEYPVKPHNVRMLENLQTTLTQQKCMAACRDTV